MVLIIYTQSLLQWLCQVNLCDQKEHDVPPPRANEKKENGFAEIGSYFTANRVHFEMDLPKRDLYFSKNKKYDQNLEIQVILNWIFRNVVLFQKT
jgi:hypothetical protein